MTNRSITAPTKELVYAARQLDYLQTQRIRRAHVFRHIAKQKMQPGATPDVKLINAMVADMAGMEVGIVKSDPTIEILEDKATKAVEKAVKDSVFGAFVKDTQGLGELSFGRLWARMGDPISLPDNSERSIGQLFQYCAVGDPKERRRERGKKTKFNPLVKPRLHMVIEPCIKLTGEPDKNGRIKKRSPYRDVYDEQKELYTGRIHSIKCHQCGGKSPDQEAKQREFEESGQKVRLKNDIPVEAGTPWKPGHIDGHAKLMVKRAFLRDTYEFALQAA